ncbi:unannotated protein [freshwater metagenome]|uniref:Unannotated protein n=1 Tax=freshwater metagenome TaxID=449393 RepID=A0A6J6Z912_9ZZZZ
MVAQAGRRSCRRHHHRLGNSRWLLRHRRRGRSVPLRTQVHHHHPARCVQLAGVVQHRRRRCTAAGFGLFHLVGGRQDGLHPQLVRRGRHHLQGRLGCGHQPVAHPFLQGTAQGRRHCLRSGELHAWRRRVSWHHQVRWQDSPRRQDGHPQCRSSRHRRVHLVQVP